MLQKLLEDFQENILSGVILVYNRYSEQPICNLTKIRTQPPVFSGEIFDNGWLWTEDFQENILGGVILIYNHYFEQPNCNLTKEGLNHRYFLEKCSKTDCCGQLHLNSPSRRFLRKHYW